MDAGSVSPLSVRARMLSREDVGDRQAVLEVRLLRSQSAGPALGGHVRHLGIHDHAEPLEHRRAATPANRTLPTPPCPHGVPGMPPYRDRPLPEHWSTISYSTWSISTQVLGADDDAPGPDQPDELDLPALQRPRIERQRFAES